MKILLTLLTAFTVTTATVKAQQWIDVTDRYIVNPSFDNNDYITGWQGTQFGAYNPHDNAEHYQRAFDTYQDLNGLAQGKYRLSMKGFYRSGSSDVDWSNYNSGKVSDYQDAKLYAASSSKEYSTGIALLSSAALNVSLGGNVSYVGNSWGWNPTSKVVPNNMEAASLWFEAGYYSNTVTDIEVNADGKLRVGVKKSGVRNADWTCVDDFRLEYWGTIVSATAINLSESSLTMSPSEQRALIATVQPTEATYHSVTWSSSNTGVATVTSDGIITAKASGTCTITAKATDGSNITAKCEVTVKEAIGKPSDLIINELMTANNGTILDPSFNYGSWMELYNPSDEAVNLAGLFITDDMEQPRMHPLYKEHGVVPAHGYKVIWFDHYGIWNKGELLQIDDKLDFNGSKVIITDGTEALCQAEYPKGIARTSYARTTDGGEAWGITSTPTPGASNNGVVYSDVQLEAPVVSAPGKVFNGALMFTVAIPEGATLRYTTDGSVPTLTNGKTSTGAFTATSTQVYRFRLFADGMLPSDVVTRTYIKKENGMLFDLPVISVVGDDKDLYSDATGIFVRGSKNGRPGNGQTSNCNWNMDWDRPVNFEYLTADADGNVMSVFNQEVDIERSGGWSRAWTPYSFKLKAAKYYNGKNSLDYPFFPAKPYLKHKVLQIRNGGNDNNCRIKDAALQQIIQSSGLYVDGQQWVPTLHYINGKFMGVINMREPNNKHFGYANYGIDTDYMDQFEMSPDSGYVQKEGTKDAFTRLVSLSKTASSEASYAEISKLLDIDEYINYMAVELYLGGNDWPQNNVKGFRDSNDGRFHFVLFDLDGTFATTTPLNVFAGKQNYTFDNLHGKDALGNNLEGKRRSGEIEVVTLFLNMLKNESFKKRFLDAFCVISGSVFSPARCEAIIRDMAGRMAPSMQIANGYYTSSPWNTANDLINRLSTSRISTLTNHVASYLNVNKTRQAASLSVNVSEGRILVNDFEVPTGKMSGYLYSPVKLRAEAPAGYRFVGWTKNASASDVQYVSTDAEYVAPASGIISLTAMFEKDEASIAKPVMVNEVSADNEIYVNDCIKKGDWIELYNTTDNDIDAAGFYVSDNLKKPQKYQIPTDDIRLNTIIPSHGYLLVWCDKLENIGRDIHASFKLDEAGGDVILSAYKGKELQWADTLTYSAHDGVHSVGRYPDGTPDVFLMSKPTIAQPNILTFDATSVEQPYSPVTAIEPVILTEGNLSMAYAGNGVINVSSDQPVTSIAVSTVDGRRVPCQVFTRNNGCFVSLSLASHSAGICIVHVTDAAGHNKQMKISIP